MHHAIRSRADKRTTDAWQAGERFTPSLALADLKVYADDGLIRGLTLQGLADRWRWTPGEVARWLRDHVEPAMWPLDLRDAV